MLAKFNGLKSPTFDDYIVFESPSKETTLLYQFNKRKMESFIYDMESWFCL